MENADKYLIDIQELKEIINLILDSVMQKQGQFIDTNDDNYYWVLNINQIFNMNIEIDLQSLEVGSLIDDVEFLKACKDNQIFNSAVFTHITPLLSYLLLREIRRLDHSKET
ncbi:hypothetical protein QSV37_18550 [Acinetobacter sp. VNK23]|uniref:hypothetical protein n=1 Tax=Acinetobacter thutiue TaxID=2998078 RepID=UPI00257669BE|nr:hypothetical protein [Acinetobacter thutiue]MDM1022264.1 hypothetical protein [Acinetobacter thutiue]